MSGEGNSGEKIPRRLKAEELFFRAPKKSSIGLMVSGGGIRKLQAAEVIIVNCCGLTPAGNLAPHSRSLPAPCWDWGENGKRKSGRTRGLRHRQLIGKAKAMQTSKAKRAIHSHPRQGFSIPRTAEPWGV